MVPFIPASPLSPAETIAATRTMLRIARADGIHAAEIELIRSFYEGAAEQGGWPTFDALLAEAGAGAPAEASALADAEHRELLVALCVMTALADGALGDAEQALIRATAADLGVSEQRLAEIVEGVKDHMLAQLSHLPDAGSVARVARELG